MGAHRIDYKEVRLHESLGNTTPAEFAGGLKSRDQGVAVA